MFTGSPGAWCDLSHIVATVGDLRHISADWLSWAAAEDGWLSVLHGEILGRTPAA
jgi:hypothetical protein